MFKHLKSVNMSYSTHMKHSLNISKLLFTSSYKAFIHSILPFVYETSSSECCRKLQKKLNQ